MASKCNIDCEQLALERNEAVAWRAANEPLLHYQREKIAQLRAELRSVTMAADDERIDSTMKLAEVVESIKENDRRYRWLRLVAATPTGGRQYTAICDANNPEDLDSIVDSAIAEMAAIDH